MAPPPAGCRLPVRRFRMSPTETPAMSAPKLILAALLALCAVGTVGVALAGGPAPCDRATGVNC